MAIRTRGGVEEIMTNQEILNIYYSHIKVLLENLKKPYRWQDSQDIPREAMLKTVREVMIKEEDNEQN